ncbi:MAG: hypothetical protein ACLSFZ_04820 [Frisingicoccus sp.]
MCSEMVSAKAIYYNNKNTEALMLTDERERPFLCSFLALSGTYGRYGEKD